MEARRGALGIALPVGRQGGDQLEVHRRGRVLQPEVLRRSGQAGHEQGLRLARGQAGELGPPAVLELEAALAAAVAPDRHAGGAEVVDVAIDGAHRDLERGGERRGADPALVLQGEQDREQAAGAHRRECAGKYMTTLGR